MFQEHWNKAYADKALTDLGWYEESSIPSWELLQKCNLSPDAQILNVGAGNSIFTDELVRNGFRSIIATDISNIALGQLHKRIAEKLDHSIQTIVDDLTNPAELKAIPEVDLWYDRAVLHFFTKEEDRATYFNLLKEKVKHNGYVIIAAFALDKGAKKCSNLDVYRYDEAMISGYLGSDFTLISSFDYDYINPQGGIRPYVYTLYQRI